MQLGTRWAAGAQPPSRLNPEFIEAIRGVEQTLAEPAGLYWTLTWLEGRPVAELDPTGPEGELVAVKVNPATGAPEVKRGDPGEEWAEE